MQSYCTTTKSTAIHRHTSLLYHRSAFDDARQKEVLQTMSTDLERKGINPFPAQDYQLLVQFSPKSSLKEFSVQSHLTHPTRDIFVQFCLPQNVTF